MTEGMELIVFAHIDHLKALENLAL